MNTVVLPTPLEAQRRARQIFWHAWLTWLSTAPDADTNAIEELLAPLAHHVRPLHQVMAEVFDEPTLRRQVPTALQSHLQLAGWPPAQAPATPLPFPAVA